MTVAFWFRRDRRVSDNLALKVASEKGELLPIYYYSQTQLADLSGNRQHSLLASLQALDVKLSGRLNVAASQQVFIETLIAAGVGAVYATEAFDTEGRLEQAAVAEQLAAASIPLKLIDSYYLVRPGTVIKPDGTAYRVYTPFFKNWQSQEFQKPISSPQLELREPLVRDFPIPTEAATFEIRAGEDFALETLDRFTKKVRNYHLNRDKTWLSGTSHLSHALAHGEIHPRTIVSQLPSSEGTEVFLKEIAWREFYADVLYRNPHTITDYYDAKFARMRYDDPIQHSIKLEAWKTGNTGYPIVDAAMRQLLETGWMHNRARMIVASFLIKDLHFEWQLGASWFEHQLTDHDPASNAHGWQWTAGCGTDASPYFRVFNPILQGEKFDPDGIYVKRFIPELRHLDKKFIHQPWLTVDGLAQGYPAPIVEHGRERDETLARYKELKAN